MKTTQTCDLSKKALVCHPEEETYLEYSEHSFKSGVSNVYTEHNSNCIS